MLVGYARVSTHDQTLAPQRDALTRAGYERIFTDTASGAAADQPGLAAALGFVSLTEQPDTTTNGGRLVFHVFVALAEFERDVIRERMQAGLAAARARGRRGGWPWAHALDDPRKITLAQAPYADKDHSIAEICTTLGVSRDPLPLRHGPMIAAASGGHPARATTARHTDDVARMRIRCSCYRITTSLSTPSLR